MESYSALSLPNGVVWGPHLLWGSTFIWMVSKFPYSADTLGFSKGTEPLGTRGVRAIVGDAALGVQMGCLDGEPGSPASNQDELRLGLWGPRQEV